MYKIHMYTHTQDSVHMQPHAHKGPTSACRPPQLLVCSGRSHLGSSECVGFSTCLSLTSGCRAGRRSSQGDTHCPGPASPSRRLGSACCRQRSFPWCRTACRGKGADALEPARELGRGWQAGCLHPWPHLSLLTFTNRSCFREIGTLTEEWRCRGSSLGWAGKASSQVPTGIPQAPGIARILG